MERQELLMSDHEFDVLDELYFVVSYEQLKEACEMAEEDLVNTLVLLSKKGWIRILNTVDEDAAEPLELKAKYHTYFYLASKKGLLAHNSN